MKKISEYILGAVCWLNTASCFATEKFEVLPDLPDPLAAYAQSAEAASVSGTTTDVSSLVGTQSVGQELNIISAIFALLITLTLIYLAGFLYTKLNKVNANLLRKHQATLKSQASVISTTALGNNKTLHVIELDGKRMLIGASANAIQLIKDLGTVTTENSEEEKEFSHIEIPTIKIPKIEIPKIEIPTINFAKLATKIHKEEVNKEVNVEETKVSVSSEENVSKAENALKNDEGINEKSEEQNQDNIIDSLFSKPEEKLAEVREHNTNTAAEHTVNPDEYTLYKKYLG